MFPDLREVALCRRHAMGPSSTLPLVTKAILYSGYPLCGLNRTFRLIELTTVGMLVGESGPQASWLLGPALCGGCQLLVGEARFWHG